MLKFTVLTENQATDRLECEHGLSFYIEYKEKKYLLDAGQSAVFLRNAETLDIDLTEVDAAVLSHAHYDHADGFEAFFEVNKHANVYASAETKKLDCYSVGSEKTRYIGVNPELLERCGERFCWVDHMDPVKIADGVWLLPHTTAGLTEVGKRTGMYRKMQSGPEDTLVPDSFLHELSLVFEVPEGLVVFNSCSHGGVANIVNEVRHAFEQKQILAYLGGFHLKAPGSDGLNCTEQEVELLGQTLMDLGIQKIYTGHCTGPIGYQILKQCMGEKLQKLYPGCYASFSSRISSS